MMGMSAVKTLEDLVAGMLALQRSLPSRPSLDNVEQAYDSIMKIDSALTSKLETLFQQPRPSSVTTCIFRAFQEMREDVLRNEANQQKLPSVAVIELEERHRHYDTLIQKVHSAIQNLNAQNSIGFRSFGLAIRRPINDSGNLVLEDVSDSDAEKFTRHKNLCIQGKREQCVEQKGRNDSSDNGDISNPISQFATRTPDRTPFRRSNGKVSPIGLSQLDHNSEVIHTLSLATAGSRSPSIPLAFEPLSTIHEDVTGGKDSLKLIAMIKSAEMKKSERLDLGGSFLNEIHEIPESIGILRNLTVLDLSANQLLALPNSIGDLSMLTDLDVSSNKLTSLPETLGCLYSLTHLRIEKNLIEELPWTIGKCTSLVELNAGFNQLKALPEAVGHLCLLRYLFVHLNCLKSLPTSLSSLTNLTELHADFNHLESIPESLCCLTTLTRLSLGSNFTELKSLPQAIGQLQMLEYLDISCNHISVLPNSFADLKNLKTLRIEGNPLRFPPLHIAEQGKEAVIEYMANHGIQKKGKLGRKKGSVMDCFSMTCFMRFGSRNEIDKF